MPINSFDTNIKETSCKFKIKATGEKIDGFKMQSSDNSIDYLANDKNYTSFGSDEVEEIVYFYQNQIDLLVEAFAKTGKLDQIDDEFVIDFIEKNLPKDLQPSLQNVKPFDTERSIFIARAWSALKDTNLIK